MLDTSNYNMWKTVFVVVLCVIGALEITFNWDLASAQNMSDAGKIVFERKCSGCHEIGPDAVNGVGPSLNNLFGRKAGTAPGFKYYSESNASAKFIWTEENFKKFIENPKSMIAATKQLFNGLKDKNDIEALTEYLKKYSNIR